MDERIKSDALDHPITGARPLDDPTVAETLGRRVREPDQGS